MRIEPTGEVPKMADDAELKAARIVENRLGGRAVVNDTGNKENEYDFKVFLPDGGFAALEVTQSLDEELAKLRAALARHSPAFSTPQLKRGWYLYLAESQTIYRRLKTRLET